ncbi:putative cAMP-dependent protein kinase type 1 [Blattamonas nauphoetae]|uniref:cAMP-dependent protein kinase type 1 n=1 Tax=Blattamonas nauphoetae TaxID=2049346 RepID=A0ABQ9XWJ9_9EUKA|nr:putative cAMP-dependent protein kinase type 1 [Blattamonas nauphoetae]
MADVDLLKGCGCTEYAYLGQGQYGRVYVVKKKGRFLAAKVINNSTVALSEFYTASMIKESQIQNPFILGIDSCLRNPETDQHVLFLDYADQGNVSDLIKVNCRKGIPEPFSKRLLYMLLSGLTDLHTNGFVHRDIKPDNLLLAYNPTTASVRLVISDFGLLKRTWDGSVSVIPINQTVCGTPLYMSPEALEEQPYNHKLDIWAAACIFYEMLAGVHPFTTESVKTLRRNVLAGPNLSHPNLMPLLVANTHLRDLLQRMFTVDPLTRIDTLDGTLLSHPYFTESQPIIDPNKVQFSWIEYTMIKAGCEEQFDVHLQQKQAIPMTNQIPSNQTDHNMVHFEGATLEGTTKQTIHETRHITTKQEYIQPEEVKEQVQHQILRATNPFNSRKRNPAGSTNPTTDSPHPPSASTQLNVNQTISSTPTRDKPNKFKKNPKKESEIKMACRFCGLSVGIEKMDQHINEKHKQEKLQEKMDMQASQKMTEKWKKQKEDEEVKARKEEARRMENARKEEARRVEKAREEEAQKAKTENGKGSRKNKPKQSQRQEQAALQKSMKREQDIHLTRTRDDTLIKSPYTSEMVKRSQFAAHVFDHPSSFKAEECVCPLCISEPAVTQSHEELVNHINTEHSDEVWQMQNKECGVGSNPERDVGEGGSF